MPFRLSNGVHFKLDALVLLNATNDLEQIAGVGVAGWSEHTHQALGGLVRESAKLFEPHGGIDVVAQHDLARVDIPGQQAVDALPLATLL